MVPSLRRLDARRCYVHYKPVILSLHVGGGGGGQRPALWLWPQWLGWRPQEQRRGTEPRDAESLRLSRLHWRVEAQICCGFGSGGPFP